MTQTTDAATGAFDICGVAYDAEGWEANLREFADTAPNYLRFFGASWIHHAGADHDRYWSALDRGPHAAVDVLVEAGGLATTPEDLVDEMDEQGLAYQVLHGGHRSVSSGGNVNDGVARMAAQQPRRLGAWAGLDLADPDAAIRELDRCVHDLGMSGATVVPFARATDPVSSGSHRLYDHAAKLGVPLWIHTGMNLASNRPLASCTWDHIDRIAAAHPDLTVIAGHGGWPWITEAMAVLQRHPRVYLEFSAHRPKIMGRPGSGWEPLMFYGRHVVRSKIMFGTAGFVQPVTPRELIAEVRQLDIGAEAAESWLRHNAAEVLGLSLRDRTAATTAAGVLG